MKGQLAIIVLICLSPFVFFQCKKYEEGCRIPKDKNVKKILCHTWKVDFFESTDGGHKMSYDKEYYSNSAPVSLPYEIWYPSGGSWVGSWSDWYYGCTTSSGLGINVNALTFQITNLEITFKEDNAVIIKYNYNNHEFDAEATNVNCDQAIYKDVSGTETLWGAWKISEEKDELIFYNLTLNNHFPLLQHCLNGQFKIKNLCDNQMHLVPNFTFTKNPGGLFPDGPYSFDIKLSH